jgi:hypothetical protein
MSEKPETKYDKEIIMCQCCEPAIRLTSPQQAANHKRRPKRSPKETEQESKKQKLEIVQEPTEEEKWLFGQMPLFQKAVLADDMRTDQLKTQIDYWEGDINDKDPNFSEKISNLCARSIENWQDKPVAYEEQCVTIRELYAKTIVSFDVIAEDWKSVIKTLKPKDLSDSDLAQKYRDYAMVTEAIKYEMEHREFEPSRIAFKYIRDRFNPKSSYHDVV